MHQLSTSTTPDPDQCHSASHLACQHPGLGLMLVVGLIVLVVLSSAMAAWASTRTTSSTPSLSSSTAR